MTVSWTVEWKHSALKDLKRIDRAMIPKILASVEDLSQEPFPDGHRKLQGTDHTYRIRIGDYRVVYELFLARIRIEVIRVGHRRDVYRH